MVILVRWRCNLAQFEAELFWGYSLSILFYLFWFLFRESLFVWIGVALARVATLLQWGILISQWRAAGWMHPPWASHYGFYFLASLSFGTVVAISEFLGKPRGASVFALSVAAALAFLADGAKASLGGLPLALSGVENFQLASPWYFGGLVISLGGMALLLQASFVGGLEILKSDQDLYGLLQGWGLLHLVALPLSFLSNPWVSWMAKTTPLGGRSWSLDYLFLALWTSYLLWFVGLGTARFWRVGFRGSVLLGGILVLHSLLLLRSHRDHYFQTNLGLWMNSSMILGGVYLLLLIRGQGWLRERLESIPALHSHFYQMLRFGLVLSFAGLGALGVWRFFLEGTIWSWESQPVLIVSFLLFYLLILQWESLGVAWQRRTVWFSWWGGMFLMMSIGWLCLGNI